MDMVLTSKPLRVNPKTKGYTSRALCALGLVVIALVSQSCATAYRPQNLPVKAIDNLHGYRLINTRQGTFGDHLILLAFSGGGTRAAALSYGVLKELRDTLIIANGHPVRMLDEVDIISSVSGGSLTAAYYGLFGDRIFDDYERKVLKNSLQDQLIMTLLEPAYLWRSLFSDGDRTESAVEFFNANIFENKTFGDIRLSDGPYIEINATDIGGANRFSFSQAYFDGICSDINSYSVARAVTASLAVPVAFSPVVLKNYTGQCDPFKSHFIRYVMSMKSDEPRVLDLQQRLVSYLDRIKHPYIHLTDGGISDNLGLRALIDRIESIGSGLSLTMTSQIPKDILVLSVDAEVVALKNLDESPEKPSVAETFEAFTDAQFKLYNNETKMLLNRELMDLKQYYAGRGVSADIYNVAVSFSSLKDAFQKAYFNSLPTTLELTGHDVDKLTAAGGELLRNTPAFRDFLRANEGRRSHR